MANFEAKDKWVDGQEEKEEAKSGEIFEFRKTELSGGKIYSILY